MTRQTAELASAQRRGSAGWLVWALAASGFAYGFFLRFSPSAMVEDLMRDFAVGAAVLGNLSAIYFYIYAGIQLPVGALIDRWGPRLMITCSIAVATLGTALFAVAQTITLAYLGRFLIGAGSAVAFVGCLSLAGRWFAPNRFAFVAGLTMLAGMVGGILGQGPLAYAIDIVGWRTAMMAAACFAALLTVLIWAVVRDWPAGAEHDRHETRSRTSPWRSMAQTMSMPRMWAIAVVAASFTGPLLAFGGLWGVPYMMAKFGIARPDAAFYVSFGLFGWALGAPTGGWLSDLVGKRKLPLVVACALHLLCLGMLLYLPGISLAASAGLIFISGLLGGTMVITYAAGREIAPTPIHGAVSGFINTATVGAGAVLQPIIGLFLDMQWDGRLADGARVYTVQAYDTAFICLMAWILMGLIFLAFVKETNCRPQVIRA